ncbi:LysR family transcriptional regulator [Prauserella muralis]|uniref:Transcriptional regulator n=1 Tax=Prauserella muralis TaxID=588067 RepID=A0A2V4AZ15_9PSEU|nr:LysR family transcriptional regulator [Prauserella muralis]PXY21170.1 transcriptional regulator [Prauserella muralis]TWE30263.1 DNA-binding transcriptional LysR family regulator [Prauserella muralis]
MSIDLSIRHLRVLVAVADAGGYSAAARTLHVAQSSLSRAVLEIEHRIGVPLFERTTRHVRPTPDGEEFLVIARRLIADFDAALNHFQGYLEGTRGSVSIAALPSLAGSMLPPVLSAFREHRPQVSVSVRDGLSQEVLAHVAGGTVDMAVTVSPTVPPSLHAQRIAVDRFVCVFPPGHRFDGCKRLTWRDLEGEPFVAFDAGTSIRAYVDATLRETGVELGPVTEARNIGAVAGLTAAGLGVSMVPALVVPMMGFVKLRRRVVAEPVVERDICLVHDPMRPLSRTARGLMATLLQAAAHDLHLPTGARWTPAPT